MATGSAERGTDECREPAGARSRSGPEPRKHGRGRPSSGSARMLFDTWFGLVRIVVVGTAAYAALGSVSPWAALPR